jgi:membrane protease subunit (stomatin/prohibitin family)
MTNYQPAQEYDNLRWGTGMPIPLMIGSQLAQVRARGTCSLIVMDIQQLQQQVPDLDNLTAHVRSLLASTIEETIGELGREASNIAQMTTVTEHTIQAFQMKLEPKFKELGLQLKAVSIEAIESV